MTVIFSTHDVALVPEVADYIYVMDKGRIVASGRWMRSLCSRRCSVRTARCTRASQTLKHTQGEWRRGIDGLHLCGRRKFPAPCIWQTIMIEELFQIERDAYKTSVIHRLDARVKIVIVFAAIIALVAVPYSTMIYTVELFSLRSFSCSGAVHDSPCGLCKTSSIDTSSLGNNHLLPDIYQEQVLH